MEDEEEVIEEGEEDIAVFMIQNMIAKMRADRKLVKAVGVSKEKQSQSTKEKPLNRRNP